MLAIKHISQVLHYYMLDCLHFSQMMAERGSDNSEGMYHALELLKRGSDHHRISLVLFHRKILNKQQFLGYGSAIVCHLELLTFKFSYCRNKRKKQGQRKCRQRYKKRANTERTSEGRGGAAGCLQGRGRQMYGWCWVPAELQEVGKSWHLSGLYLCTSARKKWLCQSAFISPTSSPGPCSTQTRFRNLHKNNANLSDHKPAGVSAQLSHPILISST